MKRRLTLPGATVGGDDAVRRGGCDVSEAVDVLERLLKRLVDKTCCSRARFGEVCSEEGIMNYWMRTVELAERPVTVTSWLGQAIEGCRSWVRCC